MELKVWVEGVQRVVCGITEQTTVQEVVIALAQATGRTGRYTLVEKWRDVEKMLPPTEQPLKVLAKWGDSASDIQFLLRRTGASSVSDTNSSNIRGPERNAYRQSLPPPAKNRGKNEILQGIKRKEPKRKSMTHTSNYENEKDKEKVGLQNTNINNNNRIPLMPTKNKSIVTSANNRQNDSKDRHAAKTDVIKASEMFNAKINLASGNQEKSSIPHNNTPGPKNAIMPPQRSNNTREASSSVSSAKEALFPQASVGELKARSPSKSSHIYERNNEPPKSAVLPSNAKYVRPRVTSSNSFDTASNNRNQNIPISHQHSSSTDAPNRRPFKDHDYQNVPTSNNSLPKQNKKQWSATESLKGHARTGSAGVRAALLPPNIKRETNSASTLPTDRPSFHPAMREGYTTQPLRDNSSKRSSQEVKAQAEFNTLLSEQQKHINKQHETIRALEEEIEMLQNDMKSREKINQSSLQAEISHLEEVIEKNGTEMMNQALLMQQISVEELTYNSLKEDMAKSQENLNKTKLDLEKLETNISDLSMNVQREIRQKEDLKQRSALNNIKSEINMKSQNLHNAEEDVKRLENENGFLENDLAGKYAMMDTLNRELRQMDLQQFIRKTGSKITVLPPNTEEQLYGQSNKAAPHAINESNQSSGGEGVWV